MRTAYLGLEAKRALRNPRFLMFTMVFPVVIFLIEVFPTWLYGNAEIGRAVIWLADWTVVFAVLVVRRYRRDSARV